MTFSEGELILNGCGDLREQLMPYPTNAQSLYRLHTLNLKGVVFNSIDESGIDGIHQPTPDANRRITGDEQDSDSNQQPNNWIKDRQPQRRPPCRDQNRQRGESCSLGIFKDR